MYNSSPNKPILLLAALLLLCSAGSSSSSAQCSEAQRRALMAFKSGLRGADSLLSSWGDEDSKRECCDWLGIRCNNVSGDVIGLDLSPRTLGSFNLTGTIAPSSLSELRSLTRLDLSCVNFTGSEFPSSIGSLAQLNHLNLSSCSLHGLVSHEIFSNLSKLARLDLSFNDRLSFSFPSRWTPPFRLSYILLRSVKLGPGFPNWLRTQYAYSALDISGSGVSEAIPDWFWNVSTTAVFIDLSNNRIAGRIVGDRSVSLSLAVAVDLSSNRLEGPVPSFLFRARFLDLSNNRFSSLDIPSGGGAGFMSGFGFGFSIMRYLDASDNELSGELPDRWSYFVSLGSLSLSNNNLTGKIPPSIGSLTAIQSLRLSNNGFTGEVPSTLRNCTELLAVDFGGNRLSESIPEWLGTSSSSLAVLVLRSNRFRGTIPRSLCRLSNLQILDLSSNTIAGVIPDCVGNFTAMRTDGRDARFVSELRRNGFSMLDTDLFGMSKRYQEKVVLQWKGKLREFGNTLGLVKSVDLSSNELSGGFPIVITEFSELVSLNLSRNGLGGKIPEKIGGMESLDALDLSRNNLVGPIPSSLAQIDRLSNLDLSNNDLSGEIPRGTQLQTFADAYAGNPKLCGDPLPRHCPETEQQAVTLGPGSEAFRVGLYVSVAMGFVAGFWGVCGTLIFNKSFRFAYFGFSDRVVDRVFVTMSIQRARFLRMIKSYKSG